MKINLLLFLFISVNLSSQAVWEPLAPLNLEDLEFIHVDEDRILAILDLPATLLVSEDLGSTWTEISDIPQLERTPLVDVDRDGNYLVLFDEAVYKLDPDGYIWTPFFELPEAPVVWNDIAAFINGNILIRERRGLRLHDSEGEFIKEMSFGNTVTKNFIKGEDDEHYFFLSPDNVFGYIVEINSDMEIQAEYPEDDFYIHSHYAFDGSRFYSTTGYSDDGRTWTDYQNSLRGNITILNNGNIHLIAGCSGGVTFQDMDCTQIYVSSDQGETFEYVRDIDLGIRLPSPGSADLRWTTRQGIQEYGEQGLILFHEKKNFYSEDGEDLWTTIGQDFGLPSMNKVEAASKENAFVGVTNLFEKTMVSQSQGWLDLSSSPCGNLSQMISLSNGTLVGSGNCISENQGQDWMAADEEVSTWGIFVKDDVVYSNNRSSIYSSTDFGKTWSVSPVPELFSFLEFTFYDFSSTGFMYPRNYAIDGAYKYSISGDSISFISFENEQMRGFITEYFGPHVFALTDNALYVSEDNAESFIELDMVPIAAADIRGMEVDHENAIYLYNNKEVWISTDYGIVWKNISPVFPDLIKINNIDISWDGYVFAATDGTPVLRTDKSDFGQVIDVDGDGYTSMEDCDDDNAEVNPGQTEVPYNGLDDDCNPETLDDDLDQDGFVLAEDCDDNNAEINPNAEEIANNQIDEDCDGADLVTSVYELSSSSINIFPNPSTSYINIKVEGQLEFQVNLYSLEGRLMHTANNTSQMITESISTGTYLLEIKDLNSGDRIVERVAIVK